MATAPRALDIDERSFFAAMRCGDLSLVQRFLDQPRVRENIAHWNGIHRAQRLGGPSCIVPKQAPWYNGPSGEDSFLCSSVVNGHQVAVFRWFFARDQVEPFGETLRSIAKDILLRCFAAQDHTAAREILEIIVSSVLIQDVMDDDERCLLLGALLNVAATCGRDQWIGVLLAYGADPNLHVVSNPPLAAAVLSANIKSFDVLLAHGAWLEDDLLTLLAYNQSEAFALELLRRGVGANSFITIDGSALHYATSRCFLETARVLIKEGFADVDARDGSGRTPLMVVGSDLYPSRVGRPSKLAVVELLFQAGGNVQAVDKHGRSVLHHMVCGGSDECLRPCLTRGADPNRTDADGQTPMAALLRQTQHHVIGCMAKMFVELLCAGADPFLLDTSGKSVVDMLASTRTGRTFLAAEQAFFRR